MPSIALASPLANLSGTADRVLHGASEGAGREERSSEDSGEKFHCGGKLVEGRGWMVDVDVV
jgi:hypothetical protein